MSRYLSVEKGVYAVFGAPAWAAEKIPTYPSNFAAKANEYIRVSIIPGSSGVNRNSIAGVVIIDIFIAANNGAHRAFEIADKLDSHFCNKTFDNVQFKTSTLGEGKEDKVNPLLFRMGYTIPFNYFESL
jgi:hypothetical protein